VGRPACAVFLSPSRGARHPILARRARRASRGGVAGGVAGTVRARLSTRKVALGQKIFSPALAARGTPLLAMRVISAILGPPAPALEVGLFAAAGWV
jgi:hypothetical protein